MASLGNNIAVAHAFSRFGFGGRPSDPLPPDPTAWLLAQLSGPDPTPLSGQPTLADCLGVLHRVGSATNGTAAFNKAIADLNALEAQEQQTFLANAVLTGAPLRERLVWFWMNHFAVMCNQNMGASATAGAFVRDAIRPNVTGTFADMLVAVMQHPAMLFSLNNDSSIGPQSLTAQADLKAGRSTIQDNINENLGRETLELYTVSLLADYAQADVDAMAYLLTGWTVSSQPGAAGFVYQPRNAQPGNQTLLGQTFAGTEAGTLAALRMLGTHPCTYQHLATKLVTHFVSDTPSAADVATIANVLSSTGGNLGAAAQAVVQLPSAWQPLTKLRPPAELVIAALRAAGVASAGAVQTLMPIVTALGQPLWRPPFPNGWSDLAADWTGSNPMLLRSCCMGSLATTLAGASALAAAQCSVWPFLSTNTVSVINQASTAHDQLTLLFSSPEFQRR